MPYGGCGIVEVFVKKATFFLEKAYRLQKNRYLCSLESICLPLCVKMCREDNGRVYFCKKTNHPTLEVRVVW